MDIEATRAAIKGALDTIPGVTGHVRRPTTPRPGDAWPLWRGGQRQGAFAFVQTFAVVIILGDNEMTADKWVDVHTEDVVNALEPATMSVTSIAPTVIGTDSGDMFSLTITGGSE